MSTSSYSSGASPAIAGAGFRIVVVASSRAIASAAIVISSGISSWHTRTPAAAIADRARSTSSRLIRSFAPVTMMIALSPLGPTAIGATPDGASS
jgi:hypothetical protein